MKTNKVFKWLYGVFMFLPMLAIGVTCAYVTFNKNAYQSYSGLQDSETQYTQIDDKNDLVTGNQYVLTNAIGSEAAASTGNTQRIYFTTINVSNYNGTYDLMSATSVGFYSANANVLYYYFYDSNNNLLGNNPLTNNTNFKITIQYISNNINNDNNVLSKIPTLFSVSYNNNNSLDNAFYYAVDQFNDSGFNKVDFVSYFDMFYNNTSIWTTFANTYMNYVLFVSLAFFIPRVLFWFINFAFSLVDGFSNKYKEW